MQKFEAHITFKRSDSAIVEQKGVECGWKFSAIDGDAQLGKEPFAYLTAFSADKIALLHAMHGVVLLLHAFGVVAIREKLEEILYDTKTGHDAMQQLNALAATVHLANAKWWLDLKTGERIERNVGELLMLVTSELAEALEGHRKKLKDDKLPHRPMFEVEIADALIRLLDIAGGMNLDLQGAFEEKMAYNAVRVDHTIEARLGEGGKSY